MDKETKRIEVLQGNNTAQTTLESLLQSKSKKTNEISINVPLSGGIDLKLLATMGFSKIRHLLLSTGEITSIHNFPDGITHFVCHDNLLESIDGLPDTIEELDVTNNMIQSIDLSRLKKLKVLRIARNELKELSGFPESLEELYCSYNQIESLDLKNVPNLRVFYCIYNHNLILENVPDSVVDIHLPDTVRMKHHENPRLSSSKEYEDYVKQYYQVKAKHDQELKQIRKREYAKKESRKSNKKDQSQKPMKNSGKRLPKCVGCGKPVGMIFSRKDEKLTAICGNNQPCDWKILIHKGFFVDQTMMLYSFLEELEETKQKFIQHKLNTVFEYISEKESSKLFEKELKLYQSTSEQIHSLLNIYQDKYFSTTKEDIIRDKQKQIQEKLLLVKEALTNNDVELAVRIQHEEIAPLASAIQREKHEVMKIISKKRDKGLVVEDETSDRPELTHYLVQEQISMNKLDENIGEKVSVEFFGKKK